MNPAAGKAEMFLRRANAHLHFAATGKLKNALQSLTLFQRLLYPLPPEGKQSVPCRRSALMKEGFRTFWHLAGIWTLLAMPLAAGTSHVYVTNHAGTTISVVDAAHNKVVEEVKESEVPEAVDFSTDGSRLYISQGPENVLTVLDRKTQQEIKKKPL